MLLLALPVFAQTPDTTSAWRYLPLEVGNMWEYEQWIEECPIFPTCETDLVGYERWTVERDSLVGDTTYFVLRIDSFSEGGNWGGASRKLVRFDTLAARGIQRYGDGGETPWPGGIPCRLDAPFDSQVDCDEGWEYVFVDGPGEIEVQVAGISENRPTKRYTGLIPWSEYVADVGLLSDGAAEFGGGGIDLSFARVGEVEYGTRIPVATEAAPTEVAVAFAVYPNPVHDATTVRFSLDTPQRVRLAVYDVLGRRVHTDDLSAQPAGETAHRLDLGGLPAGVYVVRLDGEAGARATARIVRQ